jgi:hypothetical protein
MLPSDIADMLNNLQPPCHASAAFGGKTLATLKDFMNSTMVSSHSSQDHFKADVKPLSNRVHSFFPSVREGNQDEHDGDDNDMGRGNSKSKSRDAKSSADAKVSPQVAVRYITTPAGKKSTIPYDASRTGVIDICRRGDSGSCAKSGLVVWSRVQARVTNDTCACKNKLPRATRFIL